MKSILQENLSVCYLCGEPESWDDPLDEHHVFAGALRKKSERMGLKVMLHHYKCHIFGPDAVHQNAENSKKLKKIAQQALMEQHGWTKERLYKELYKIY